jgi:hypothetical protein
MKILPKVNFFARQFMPLFVEFGRRAIVLEGTHKAHGKANQIYSSVLILNLGAL